MNATWWGKRLVEVEKQARPLTERDLRVIELAALLQSTEEYDPSVAVSQDHRTRGNAR